MPLSQVSSCLSDTHDHGLGVLLPHLAEAVVEMTELAGARLFIWARARAEQAACRGCGRFSGRVHSRYERRLADAAIGGRPPSPSLLRLLSARNRGLVGAPTARRGRTTWTAARMPAISWICPPAVAETVRWLSQKVTGLPGPLRRHSAPADSGWVMRRLSYRRTAPRSASSGRPRLTSF